MSAAYPVPAGVDWAARDAQRHALPLHLVHAWIWQPPDVPTAQDLDTQKQRPSEAG